MSIQVIDSIAALREALRPLRAAGGIGLVPTMGALHAGHGSLIGQARRENGCVVVSVFVNPIQFNQRDDFDHYPRTLESDRTYCEARGAHIVFAPSQGEMYPDKQQTFVEVRKVTDHLCGPFRPGHFTGVATVVLKLLNIVQPDRAYFGIKDAQQVAVIRRMLRDLNLPVELVEVPTVREEDGLALSSRNTRLTPEQRSIATVLYRALQAIEQRIACGVIDADEARRSGLAVLAEQPSVRVEYLEIVDPEEMQPVSRIAGPVRAAGAVWVGGTRLIDNVLCVPR